MASPSQGQKPPKLEILYLPVDLSQGCSLSRERIVSSCPESPRWRSGAVSPCCITCHFQDKFGSIIPSISYFTTVSGCSQPTPSFSLPTTRPKKPSFLQCPCGLGASGSNPLGTLSRATSGSLCCSGSGVYA